MNWLLFRPATLAAGPGRLEDDSVTVNKALRDREARIRELEGQPGRKTLENEILKETLEKSRAKKQTWLAQSLKRDGSP